MFDNNNKLHYISSLYNNIWILLNNSHFVGRKCLGVSLIVFLCCHLDDVVRYTLGVNLIKIFIISVKKH